MNPVDPVKLAREYIKPFGGKIDDALAKIEDHLEELANATQGNKTENIPEDRRKAAQKMFRKEENRSMLRWLFLRASLSPEMAQEVKTYEITNNAGLGLTDDELCDYVSLKRKPAVLKTVSTELIELQNSLEIDTPEVEAPRLQSNPEEYLEKSSLKDSRR